MDADTDLPQQQLSNHVLYKSEKRQICSLCYKKIVSEAGRKIAKNKTPRTNLRCNECSKYLCLDCYFEEHFSTTK